jgi:hypothetical protein
LQYFVIFILFLENKENSVQRDRGKRLSQEKYPVITVSNRTKKKKEYRLIFRHNKISRLNQK